MLATSTPSLRRWWIEEPTLVAASSPSDEDLSALRAEGFGVAVSLLDANHQRPRYDVTAATGNGWMLYTIPIDHHVACPTLIQACEFVALVGAVSRATRSLVFCKDGVARSAFMGAVYWIARGVPVSAAIERVSTSANVDSTWIGNSAEVLGSFEKLGWRLPA